MKQPFYSRICRVCGRQFRATHWAHRLCSEACRYERDRFQHAQCMATLTPGPLRKTCVICHADFLAGKDEARPRRSTTCSQDCQRAFRARRAAEYGLKIKTGRTRICVECGATYLVSQRPRKKTCSERCAQHRRREQNWRCRQTRKAKGLLAVESARRTASGYMKRYKRQWRRRRAEERARMEMLLLTTAVTKEILNQKGNTCGNQNQESREPAGKMATAARAVANHV